MSLRFHLLAACAVITAALAPTSALALHSGALGPNACHISLPDLQGIDVCFSPSRVRVAEQRMPIAPVHPGQIVWRLTGLRLRHVMLRISSRPFDIEYLYGHMPLMGTTYQVPTPGGTWPKYVLISENTYLVNHPLAHPVAQGGYWVYDQNLVCRHLALSVTTNLTSSAAVVVANQVQARTHCGK